MQNEVEKKARSTLERNSIAPINRHTVLSVNYSIVNVSHQNQLVLASNSAVQDIVENNIQISEKRKRGRPKKSNNESEQPSKSFMYLIFSCNINFDRDVLRYNPFHCHYLQNLNQLQTVLPSLLFSNIDVRLKHLGPILYHKINKIKQSNVCMHKSSSKKDTNKEFYENSIFINDMLTNNLHIFDLDIKQ
ncbi:hypothetical protein BpHYR1_017694 [Brachionus plicatilis]|uniref:Uncharacterized protein n=1 Tax=Brachionus plicatilis TaxID=10195 RepID=A0A3M7S9A8_BRAPC|nr:hypothetical protein BpHYR1_017694 [Brachionus plicatilis]